MHYCCTSQHRDKHDFLHVGSGRPGNGPSERVGSWSDIDLHTKAGNFLAKFQIIDLDFDLRAIIYCLYASFQPKFCSTWRFIYIHFAPVIKKFSYNYVITLPNFYEITRHRSDLYFAFRHNTILARFLCDTQLEMNQSLLYITISNPFSLGGGSEILHVYLSRQIWCHHSHWGGLYCIFEADRAKRPLL